MALPETGRGPHAVAQPDVQHASYYRSPFLFPFPASTEHTFPNEIHTLAQQKLTHQHLMRGGRMWSTDWTGALVAQGPLLVRFGRPRFEAVLRLAHPYSLWMLWTLCIPARRSRTRPLDLCRSFWRPRYFCCVMDNAYLFHLLNFAHHTHLLFPLKL